MKVSNLIAMGIINLILFPNLGFFGLLFVMILEIMVWGAIDGKSDETKAVSNLWQDKGVPEDNVLYMRDVSDSRRLR